MLETCFSTAECEPDKAMSVCCCGFPKFLLCFILIFDVYVLAFKKDVILLLFCINLGEMQKEEMNYFWLLVLVFCLCVKLAIVLFLISYKRETKKLVLKLNL